MIRDLRERANLSQEALAHLAGVSVATIVKLENGRVIDPTWSTIRRLAQALKVDCRAFAEIPMPQNRRGKPRKKRRNHHGNA